jgi:serine/threonine-protein kinase
MNVQCSTTLLESALAGHLPAEDESALQRHLETCAACSAALERMAGGTAWCQEAAALLAGDELDDAVPPGEEWSEADFTVEHLEPAEEPNVLGRLGDYDVLEIIGRGGMGVVLKGFERELKRYVAIKVLAPHLAQSSVARKRFIREAQAAAAVVHPHVMAIHQVQPHGRLPFLVMPLVAGESLAERLAAQGILELKEILRIGMQAAAGLAAAHEQGLVHRDVKPANILLEHGVERAVLTDFGLARAADDVSLTRYGVIAGTPQYMSPEQAKGEAVDGRSDLFSLGCVLYEMASGVSPFRTDSMMATLRRLIDEQPQALTTLNPELPPWFVAIVERLLEKDPARRFASAKEVSELLGAWLAHVQQPASVAMPAAPPPIPVAPVRGQSRRVWQPRHAGIIAAGVVLAIGGLGILLMVALNPTGDGKKLPDSHETATINAHLDDKAQSWAYGPTVTKTLICPSDNKSPLGQDALRLEDGKLFNLPKKGAGGKNDPSPEELEKWHADAKINLVIDYRKETDQWEMKLRNVKFAELADKEWKTLSAAELQGRFAKLKWAETTKAEATQKDKGLASLLLTRGMNPPITFAFETSSGQRGILQLFAAMKTATRRTASVRYKELQPAEASKN